MKTLEEELRTGFRGLSGSQVAGSLRVPERVVNETLRDAGGLTSQVQVEIKAANKLVIHYKSFHVEAALAPELEVGASPRLHVDLTSTMIAWTLKTMLVMPGISINGKRITVDLAEVAQLRPYRENLRHVRQLRFATTPGLIELQFDVAVA
ncbi:MAG TPA: hypothetical protein VNJ02_20010 [Vicinamibacterales bacterium]|nr:hypothetical protein [Vicinamibacterales bacterium]